MLLQISLAPVCGREGGKDFPTALHAMLRHDGKLCSFLKLSDDTSCITHGACKDNDRNAPESGVVVNQYRRHLA